MGYRLLKALKIVKFKTKQVFSKRYMGRPSHVSTIVAKGNRIFDIHFTSLDNETLLMWNQLLMERISPIGANSLL